MPHVYETTLLALLKEGNEKEVKKVIDLIRHYEGREKPSLTASIEGYNFLQHALIHHAPKIAMILLKCPELNNDILFCLTPQSETLILLATKCGAVNVAKKLYALSSQLMAAL